MKLSYIAIMSLKTTDALEFPKLARVLVCFDHVARFYQRHDHVNLPFLFISMLR